MGQFKDRLPAALLQKADQVRGLCYWRLSDIPEVIMAVRDAGLMSIGGELQFMGKKGTPTESVGTCESYWLRVVNDELHENTPDASERIAQHMLSKFQRFMAETDFQAAAQEWPTVVKYLKQGGKLDDVMRFDWYINDKP